MLRRLDVNSLKEPKATSLTVKEKYAKLIGDVKVYLEVEGYISQKGKQSVS